MIRWHKIGLILIFVFSFVDFTFCQQKNYQTSELKDPISVGFEQMPQFPGGDKALVKFFRDNINYPTSARINNIEGNVVIQFIIDSSGIIDSPKVLRSLSPDCDTEGLRIIRIMPKWMPGRNKGRPVKVHFTLPIKFQLEESSRPDVYSFVDRMPQFPGGDSVMISFIKNNLVYPYSAKINKIEGTVTTKFVVDELGNLVSPTVIKGLSLDCNKEALRILSVMPKWIPGRHNGKDVKVSFNLPIRFKLP